MPIIIIDNATDLGTVIIRKNDYCILINSKVVMKSLDGDEWISDEILSPEEWDALHEYLRS